MKTNRMLIVAAVAFSLAANAQVRLNDKNANAYDLGYGVEISDFFSTASATTVTINPPSCCKRITNMISKNATAAIPRNDKTLVPTNLIIPKS